MLFVSSLWPYKNCDGLLRAFAAARSELGDRQLVVVGPGRDEQYVAELHALAAELGIADDVVWVGGVPLEETVHFYRAADVFVYPSFNETFGLPILEAMACGCPVVTSDTSAMPETAGGARRCSPTRPTRSRSPTRSCGPAGRRPSGCAPPGLARAAEFTWAATAERTLAVYRDVYARAGEERRTMRVLVTGGAGFIGSHTCDRLVELGHDVVVLDALTAPVHRDGEPCYLTPGVELFVGDVRNRDLLANLLRRVDAVVHFAALPGLPARLRHGSPTSTSPPRR